MTMNTPKPRRRRFKKRYPALIILALLVGYGVFQAVTPKPPPVVEVNTEKVSRRTLTSLVSATGRIYPEMEVKISSEVAGEIIELPVKEGQRVSKGDLLVKVNPETYDAQVQQREAALNVAKANAAQARAQLEQAQLELRRVVDLAGKNFVSENDLDTAKTLVKTRQASLEASEFQIKQQENLLSEARENLSRTTIMAPMDGSISALNSEQGERVVGTGQFAGTEIMRIANLDRMEVRIDVNENDIVNVAVGNTVRVTVDALPDKPLVGQVSEIRVSAQTTGSRTQQELTTFEVRILLADHEGLLRPGMSATAEIETKTVANAIAVPLQSVTVRDRPQIPGSGGPGGAAAAGGGERPAQAGSGERPAPAAAGGGSPGGRRGAAGNGGRPQRTERVVFVRDGDKVVRRVVETGISDPTHIEIKSGLQEGEVVVTGPYSAIARTLQDGALVKDAPPPGRSGFGRGGPGERPPGGGGGNP